MKLFLPVTTVFGDAQTPANQLVYKVTLANGDPLSTLGLTADMSGVATNGAILISGTLKAGVSGAFDVRVSATDAGPGTPLTVTDTFTVNVVHPASGSIALVNGSLLDGYIAGATVFMDSNGDGSARASRRRRSRMPRATSPSRASRAPSSPTRSRRRRHRHASALRRDLQGAGGIDRPDAADDDPQRGLDQGMALSEPRMPCVRRSGSPRRRPHEDRPHRGHVQRGPDPEGSGGPLYVTSSQILNTVALLQAASPNANPSPTSRRCSVGQDGRSRRPGDGEGSRRRHGLFGGFADDAAKIVLASNALLAAKADPTLSALDILTQTTAVSIVAKGITAAALNQAFTLSQMDTVVGHFTGAVLAAEGRECDP